MIKRYQVEARYRHSGQTREEELAEPWVPLDKFLESIRYQVERRICGAKEPTEQDVLEHRSLPSKMAYVVIETRETYLGLETPVEKT